MADAQHPAQHPARLPPDELLRSCDTERFRASGPGGQHRNKVETAVRLIHRPTGVGGQASERRVQRQNHAVAVFRLRVNLALEVRTAVDPDSQPSELWAGRVRGGRLSINPGHDDFPALLAEALDRISAFSHAVRAAAEALGVSLSQLLKLLRHEPRALEGVNDDREQAGLPRLR